MAAFDSTEQRPVSSRRGGIVAFIGLAAVLFTPSAMRFAIGGASLTVGLLTACAAIIAMGLAGFYRLQGGRYWSVTLVTITVVVLIIVAQGSIASLWFPPDMGRAGGSLIVAVVMVICAYLVRTILDQADNDALDTVMVWMGGLFLLIALCSLAGLEPAGFGLAKPIFPFTEPSHFALSFTPFLIYHCVRSPLIWKIILLTIALAIAYFLESLSLVTAVMVAALCSLSGPLLIAGMVSGAIVIANINVSYFTDRLDFTVNSGNLSVLVYIQGVELIEAAVHETQGWGIGFQQLGVAPLNVPTTELIYRLLRDDANLLDGGFLAAKLIAEMGYIGMVLVLAYTYLAIRATFLLRRLSNGDRQGRAHELLALSIIVALSIETFVRGVGYFSGTVLLLVTAVMMTVEGGYLTRRPSPGTKEEPA